MIYVCSRAFAFCDIFSNLISSLDSWLASIGA